MQELIAPLGRSARLGSPQIMLHVANVTGSAECVA